MRYRNRQRFNIIGFNVSSKWRPTKSCATCHAILVPRVDLKTGDPMPGLMCPRDGTPYTEKEAPSEEGLKGKFKGKQMTRIISAKSKKKYYDKQGNEINDPDLIQDIRQGANVLYYHEEKQGQDSFYDEETRRIVRSINKEGRIL
ncbi:MAG TPA: hypothetical protein VD710_07540 [Nitrososphaeraceae archaeon]|nr:hypothetical protein [Nitrososphaeraceae archaeon]